MLNYLNLELLHLIDFYEPYVDEPWTSPTDFSRFKPLAIENMKPYADRVQWHFCQSKEAADEIPDNSLEFVYIDANHSYSFVKQDIASYWSKVKSGGILGGHDYFEGCPGVLKAVNEFIKKSKLKLHHDEKDWWVEKP